MRFIPVFFAAALLSACSAQSASTAKDIFTGDEGDESMGNARRRPATNDEKLKTIDMHGCTGHLLTPNYMLTARHCNSRAAMRYTSGYALARGDKGDLDVEKVIERTYNELDYAILKVRWRDGFPAGQEFTRKIAVQESDVLASPTKGEGDEVYTVGFPVDKKAWGATYAEGHMKKTDTMDGYYDIGTINGNSGGAVWRKSDGMLVALTNNGKHDVGQAGWDKNDVTNPEAWNRGSSLWAIYKASAFLKAVFADGTYSEAAEADFLAAGGGGDIDNPIIPKSHRFNFVVRSEGLEASCGIDGMKAYFFWREGEDVANLDLTTNVVQNAGCDSSSTVRRNVIFNVKVKERTACGTVIYEGDAIGERFERNAGAAFYGSDGPTTPAIPIAVRIEDAAAGTCAPTGSGNFLVVETTRDGKVTKYQGTRQ